VIRDATLSDAGDITEIYNYYIDETAVTFETAIVSEKVMKQRIRKVFAEGLPWLVATEGNDKIVGYAYSTPWRERSAYRFTVEISVYLSDQSMGKGIGTALYQRLFEKLKRKGVHSVIGGITLPNPASIALHEKFSMKQVAHFKQVGFKFVQWQDVGYWQVITGPE
jgi:phosphinothricin acetyltransferase